MDNIEVNYARAKGIKVFNTPEASSPISSRTCAGTYVCTSQKDGSRQNFYDAAGRME